MAEDFTFALVIQTVSSGPARHGDAVRGGARSGLGIIGARPRAKTLTMLWLPSTPSVPVSPGEKTRGSGGMTVTLAF
jgi:hypothetical protein